MQRWWTANKAGLMLGIYETTPAASAIVFSCPVAEKARETADPDDFIVGVYYGPSVVLHRVVRARHRYRVYLSHDGGRTWTMSRNGAKFNAHVASQP